jgi:hypothetical protein
MSMLLCSQPKRVGQQKGRKKPLEVFPGEGSFCQEALCELDEGDNCTKALVVFGHALLYKPLCTTVVSDPWSPKELEVLSFDVELCHK